MSVGPVSFSGSSAWAAGSLLTRLYLRECRMGPAKRLILMTRVLYAGKVSHVWDGLSMYLPGKGRHAPLLFPKARHRLQDETVLPGFFCCPKMSPCFCRKHLAEGRALKNFFRDAVSLAPYFLGLVRGTVKPARYTIPAAGLVIGMIPASSNDRFRKEKK